MCVFMFNEIIIRRFVFCCYLFERFWLLFNQIYEYHFTNKRSKALKCTDCTTYWGGSSYKSATRMPTRVCSPAEKKREQQNIFCKFCVVSPVKLKYVYIAISMPQKPSLPNDRSIETMLKQTYWTPNQFYAIWKFFSVHFGFHGIFFFPRFFLFLSPVSPKRHSFHLNTK